MTARLPLFRIRGPAALTMALALVLPGCLHGPVGPGVPKETPAGQEGEVAVTTPEDL